MYKRLILIAVLSILFFSAPNQISFADEAEDLYNGADENIILEDYKEAIRKLRKAVKLKPKMYKAWFKLAGCYERTEDGKNYLKEEKSECFLAGFKRSEKAIECYKKALGGEYLPKKCLSKIAALHYYRGELKKSLKSYKKLSKADKDNINIRYVIAYYLFRMEKHKEAEKEIEQILKSKPDLSRCYHILAKIKCREGKYDKGAELVKKAYQINANDLSNFTTLSYVYEQKAKSLSNKEEKRKEYLKATNVIAQVLARIDKKRFLDLTIRLSLSVARLIAEAEKFDHALKIVKGILKKKPDNIHAKFQLYNIYEKQGKFKKAEEGHLKLLKENPKDPDVLNGTAWFYATVKDDKFKKPKRALELAKKAVEIYPIASHILDTLAEAYYINKDYENAIKYIKKAMSFYPENIKYYKDQLEKFEKAAGKKPEKKKNKKKKIMEF